MRPRASALCTSRAGLVTSGFAALVLALAGLAGPGTPARSPETVADGEALFLREWLPGDARSHGGDGLGPVYNDSSCIACHNLGGPGGAGPAGKNVDILSAFVNGVPTSVEVPRPPAGYLRRALGALVGLDASPPPAPSAEPARPKRPNTGPLVQAHAGFRTARSLVLHRFATDSGYESWRRGLLGFGLFAPPMPPGAPTTAEERAMADLNQARALIGTGADGSSQIGEFAVVRSQRNPTALFGAGRIDAIPDAAIEAAARAAHPDQPEVAGRVSRQKDGRIGRFGWKGQTPRLADFVLTACAVELGLEVPNHHQAGLPQSPATAPRGLDLDAAECASLIAYVRALPQPIERGPSDAWGKWSIAEGRRRFTQAGCAACHAPSLGGVEGIYSDLLLHDMGPELGDTGAYGVFVPDPSAPDFVDPEAPAGDEATAPPTASAPGAVTALIGEETVVVAAPPPGPTTPGGPLAASPRPTTGPASHREWRTPPLWGVRDSGPYLHDGRAQALEQAIALHGGEGTPSAQRYFQLSPSGRQYVQAFLKSLVAPTEAAGTTTD